MTFHREGRLAHRTLRVAARAVEFARSQSLTVQVVAVVDQGDPETLRHVLGRADVVERVDFGDVASARNHGIDLAEGKYVALLDGDDYVSENWLTEAYKAAEARSGAFVLVPDVEVRYDRDHHISWGASPDFVELDLFLECPWGSTCFAPREVFANVPFVPAREGFGHVTWHWHCQLAANDVAHVPVSQTSCFARLKPDNSLSLKDHNEKAIMQRTSLFEAERVRAAIAKQPASSPTGPTQGNRFGAKEVARFGYRSVRWVYRRTLRKALKNPEKVTLAVQKLRGTTAVATVTANYEEALGIPAWLREQWVSLNMFDPDINYVRDLYKFRIATPARFNHADLFLKLLDNWPAGATHLFMLPWLKRGGADILAAHYVNIAVQKGLAHGAACIMTMPDADSPWTSLLDSSVPCYNYGFPAKDLEPWLQRLILTRAIVQMQPKVIHNINSLMFYEACKDHGPAFDTHSKLFGTVFCIDFSADGFLVGMPVDDFDDVIDHYEGFLSDNQSVIDWLLDIYGWPSEKFVVNYTPAEIGLPVVPDRTRHRKPESAMNILWASRLDRQKRPDVLLDIVKRLAGKPITFHVFGGKIWAADDAVLNELAKQPNVEMRGSFDGILALPLNEMDAFLYTSEWDGIPVVLLQVARANLPCIVPPLGGIPEVFGEGRGKVVNSREDVDGYVEAIEDLWRNPQVGEELARKAAQRLLDAHSEDSFLHVMRDLKGYSA